MIRKKDSYCGCGDIPVKYFIAKDNGTFYWCGNCVDYETMDMILRILGLYPKYEIGEYDGPMISSYDGRLLFSKQLNDLYSISQELADSDQQDLQSIADEIAGIADRLKKKTIPYEAIDKRICPYWSEVSQLCTHDYMRDREQKKSEVCNGLLANCKVPKYKLENE